MISGPSSLPISEDPIFGAAVCACAAMGAARMQNQRESGETGNTRGDFIAISSLSEPGRFRLGV